ncbi:MAG: hypothetical protein Q7S68_01910, partial [Deltaproteobacteria bacterium]|nr:hypothetical protein [Deltaproteobacteria bacterium]
FDSKVTSVISREHAGLRATAQAADTDRGFPKQFVGGRGTNEVWGPPQTEWGARKPVCGSDITKVIYEPLFSRGRFADLKILGALASTYILCEDANHQLILIDQHAAHEWIGYEKLRRSLQEKAKEAQVSLVPRTWEATPKQFSVLSEHLPTLQRTGLEIEPFGTNTFVVKSAPTLIASSKIIPLLEKLAQDLETLEKSSALETVIDHIFKTMSCHLQVRARDKLAIEEMRHLLVEMDEYHATHCPHGRPTAVEISLHQIEKMFKRT